MEKDDAPDGAHWSIAAIPQAQALRLRLVRAGDGEAEMAMPWAAELVDDVASGALHGGAITTLLDTACGLAVMSHPGHQGAAATLDLRIDHTGRATSRAGLRAVARCRLVTANIALVTARASEADSQRLIAIATATFTNEE